MGIIMFACSSPSMVRKTSCGNMKRKIFVVFSNFKNESGLSIMYDEKREKNRGDELAAL
jgi:hypothetical protein